MQISSTPACDKKRCEISPANTDSFQILSGRLSQWVETFLAIENVFMS